MDRDRSIGMSMSKSIGWNIGTSMGRDTRRRVGRVVDRARSPNNSTLVGLAVPRGVVGANPLPRIITTTNQRTTEALKEATY